MDSLRQSFDELVVHTPVSHRALAAAMVVLDVRLPRAVRPAVESRPAARELELETATVTGRDGHTVHTDRGDLEAAADRRRARLATRAVQRGTIQPPQARLSRGLEVHPPGDGEEMELWIDHRYVRAGYGWSFPAREELRVGVGSFWPSHHVKEPTVRLARDLHLPAQGYQGNWIPHQLRRAVEDGVFFVGDSAGHCLPLTAEGIRTALYFGLACGRELRAVVGGQRTHEQALARYGAFSDAHARKFGWLLNVQRAVGQITPSRAMTAIVRAFESRRLSSWVFQQYLAIAPPSFVGTGAPPRAARSALVSAGAAS